MELPIRILCIDLKFPILYSESLESENIAKIAFAMKTLERDVGCMQFPYVEREFLNSTKWQNGLVFIYENELADVACYSAVGQSQGFLDGSVFDSMVDIGVPAGNQNYYASRLSLIRLANGGISVKMCWIFRVYNSS